MVPFVLNDFVSGPVAGNIPWDQPGFESIAVLRDASSS